MSQDFILETRGLSKEFLGFNAVSDVNLKVRRGTIHALIGPNGAGKTTVFNLLTKYHQPTAGQILFNGNDITRDNQVQVARRGMIRYKDHEGKTHYCHTLNGSGLATSRVFPAILEQFQQADGSVIVPEALRPFMGGVSVLKPIK